MFQCKMPRLLLSVNRGRLFQMIFSGRNPGDSLKSLHKLIACGGAFIALSALWANAAVNIYMSPAGNDSNPGSSGQPVATLAAQILARASAGYQPVNVWLHGGTCCLPDTLLFTEQDSGTKDAPVIYQAYKYERPVISGGVRLELQRTPKTR